MTGSMQTVTKPAVVFITGLSGSGKTTLAKKLIEILDRDHIKNVLLDGDDIRNAIQLHSFDEESRKRHNLYVGYMASLLEKEGNIVLVCLISPYEEIRERIRGMCKRFIEVYLSTDLETCKKRDPKGLYAKAIKGEIPDFTGISAPYFPPQHPDLSIDTAVVNLDNAAKMVIDLL